MPEDPIPLYDGDVSGSAIVHAAQDSASGATTVRCRRTSPRRRCEHVLICFSPRLLSGRVDQAECPVRNIAMRGIALEYDQKLLKGTTGHVDYRTVSGRPVHVGCTVRRCVQQEDGRFLLGLELHRKLQFDECKPARRGIGREVAPGIRARKLQSSATPPSASSADPTTQA